MSYRAFAVVAAATIFASGCAETHSAQIDAHATTQMMAAQIDADASVIKLHCADGKDLEPGCGLLLAHVSTPKFRSYFRDMKCDGKSDAECQAIFDHDVDESLAERYWAADRNAVAQKCAGRCDDAKVLETELLTSHNMNVLTEIGHRQAAIESDADRAHALDHERAEAKTMLLVGMLASVHHTHY